MNIEAGQILDQTKDSSVPVQPPMGGANKDVQPPPAIQKEEQVSSKLAVLMERERQAVSRERLAKAQEEKLSDRLQKIEQFESVKKDPKKALEFLGLSYDELTQSILKDGEIPPSVEIQRLREELEHFKSQSKQKEDLEVEEKKKQILKNEDKAVTDFKNEITEHLKANQERYELISFEEANELVFEVIDEHYNRTVDQESGVGKIMPISEAADKVEQYLEEKYLRAKEKNKVKAFWANVPKGIQDQLEKQKSRQPPKTLTNNLGPKVTERSTRPPEDKRIQQILADHVAKMRSQFVS